MNKMTLTPLFLISASFFLFTGIAHAEEPMQHNQTHHGHMTHESHSQHQLSDVQRGHIHHVHEAGSWMFEYRYMRMAMDGMLDGGSDVSAADVVMMGSAYKNTAGGNYMMAPTDMTMDMHMLMGMYALSNDFSWMLMLNYLDNKMNMVRMNGMTSTMASSGLSDIEIGAMYKVYDQGNTQFLTNLAVSLPTGSIQESDNNAMLPYAMQLGSGSYDLIPSFTYRDNQNQWSWGLQGSYTYRLSSNSQDYTLGNRTDGQAWLQMNPLDNTSVTARLTYLDLKSITGSANDITMMQRNMSPTFVSENSGGSRLDASIGISQMFENGHMIGVGYGVPVQQNQQGLQMKVKQVYNLSWQYMY